MSTRTRFLALLAGLATLVAALPLRADVEVTDAQGRRILLKDDRTWRFVDEAETDKAAPAKVDPLIDLSLVRASGTGATCNLEFLLDNRFPYEIRSLALDFSVQRAAGVTYQTQILGFGSIRPGDRRQRTLRFDGIACSDIAAIQVSGGDRCEMGELTKFTDVKGACLARVRVLPNPTMRFEKPAS